MYSVTITVAIRFLYLLDALLFQSTGSKTRMNLGRYLPFFGNQSQHAIHGEHAPNILAETELEQRIEQVLKHSSVLDKSRRRMGKRVSTQRLSRIMRAYHDTIQADRCAHTGIIETQVSFVARLTTTKANDRDEARRIIRNLLDREDNQENRHAEDIRTITKELRSHLWPELRTTIRAKLTAAKGVPVQDIDDLLDSFASFDELLQGLSGLINELMQLSDYFVGDELVFHILHWRHRLNREIANYLNAYLHWVELRSLLAKRLYRDPDLNSVRAKVNEKDLMELVVWLYPRVYGLRPLKDLKRGTWVLISGTPASGKSTIAADIAQRLGIRTVYPGDAGARELVRNALVWFLERDLDRYTIQHSLFRALYQSSFEGDLVDFYEQALLTMRLGLEPALMVHNDRSVVFENVSILPGALLEPLYELGDVHVITLDVKPEVHQQRFVERDKPGTVRGGSARYLRAYPMIRNISERLIWLSQQAKSTVIDNSGNREQAIEEALAVINSAYTDPVIEVADQLRVKADTALKQHRALLKEEQPKLKLDAAEAFKPQAQATEDQYTLEQIDRYLTELQSKKFANNARLKALEAITEIFSRIHDPHTFVFDLGQVLVAGENRIAIENFSRVVLDLKLKDRHVRKLYKRIFKGKPIPHVNYMALKINQAEAGEFASYAFQQFQRVVGTKLDRQMERQEISAEDFPKAFLDFYLSSFEVIPENMVVVDLLMKIGYPVFALTNIFPEKLNYEKEQSATLKRMHIVDSHTVGVSKPSPQIYVHLLHELQKVTGQVPESNRVLFFDNQPRNLNACPFYALLYRADSSRLVDHPIIREFFTQTKFNQCMQDVAEVVDYFKQDTTQGLHERALELLKRLQQLKRTAQERVAPVYDAYADLATRKDVSGALILTANREKALWARRSYYGAQLAPQVPSVLICRLWKRYAHRLQSSHEAQRRLTALEFTLVRRIAAVTQNFDLASRSVTEQRTDKYDDEIGMELKRRLLPEVKHLVTDLVADRLRAEFNITEHLRPIANLDALRRRITRLSRYKKRGVRRLPLQGLKNSIDRWEREIDHSSQRLVHARRRLRKAVETEINMIQNDKAIRKRFKDTLDRRHLARFIQDTYVHQPDWPRLWDARKPLIILLVGKDARYTSIIKRLTQELSIATGYSDDLVSAVTIRSIATWLGGNNRPALNFYRQTELLYGRADQDWYYAQSIFGVRMAVNRLINEKRSAIINISELEPMYFNEFETEKANVVLLHRDSEGSLQWVGHDGAVQLIEPLIGTSDPIDLTEHRRDA